MPSLPASELQALKERAERARESWKDDSPAIVIEFSGSPKAGKTTNIDIVCHFFKRSGFKVWAPTEGASKRTPYHLRRDLVAFNTWSLNYAISELLVAYHNVDRQNLIILDRGPFDSLAWMRVLCAQGKLSDKEFEIIKQFALHPKWFQLISRINLFTCSPADSLERELETKLTHAAGTAMNESMLEALLEQYRSLRDEFAEHRVKPFDTSKTEGPLKTAKPIAEDILSLMEAQAN